MPGSESLPTHIALHLATVPAWRRELVALEPGLSPEEQARAARFRRAADHERFVLGRVVLRRLLGRVLGCPPAQVPLALSPAGKPLVADATCPLRFSLTHAGDTVLVALAAGAEIGVDLAVLDPALPVAGLAEDWLSAGERAILRGLPEAAQVAGFLTCWTAREACGKATGVGVLPPGEAPDLSRLLPLTPPAGPHALSGWWLSWFQPLPGSLAALASDVPHAPPVCQEELPAN